MTPPPAAEDKARSIVGRIRAANKRRAAIEASPTFRAEMGELERLGKHPAWALQIEAELRNKR